jgi:arylsulfatase A-like enzyme
MIVRSLICLLVLVQASIALSEQPSFVFIMADDLGWADVSSHGGLAPTPTLDAMARDGLELRSHYVAPVCSPTRTSLMTGRCWSRLGVTSPQNEQALPTDTITLARALKDAGYDTCLTGKWHLGSLPEQGPNHYGFDHSYGSLAGGVTSWTHRYKQGPFTYTWHRNETLIDQEGHVTDLITEEAIQWLKQRTDAPFFLYVPFTAVHLPVEEPQSWLDRVPKSIEGELNRHYAACIMHLDDAVRRILETLDEIDKRENTLIVFTSDNGGSTAENRDPKYPENTSPQGRLPGSNQPFRGEKGTLYEGGTRVPTFVLWNGRSDKLGAKRGFAETPVQIIDWMPTFCALAGYKPTADLHWDGTDLTAVLVRHESLPPRSLYAVGPNGRSRSLRHGPWKLILNGSRSGRDTELFNLRDDPSETTNIADSHAAIVRELIERMKPFESK